MRPSGEMAGRQSESPLHFRDLTAFPVVASQTWREDDHETNTKRDLLSGKKVQDRHSSLGSFAIWNSDTCLFFAQSITRNLALPSFSTTSSLLCEKPITRNGSCAEMLCFFFVS